MARWVTKGAIAARSGKYSDASIAWDSIKGKPPMHTKPKGWRGDPMLSGKYVTAQQEFLRGYHQAKTNPRRRKNGRSYAQKGVSIGVPRYSFDPKIGDQFYLEGKLITIKKVDRDGMLEFRPSVDGTFAMSAGNLYQATRVPETSRFAPYDVRMRHQVPNGRLVPAKIKHNGRTYSGKVKRVNGKVKIYLPPSAVRKINPERRWDIHEIKDANRAAGMHFFDRDTMKFFHSKVFPTVYQGPGGVYFVTSEYRDSPSDREYKVRQFNVSNASIRTETTYKDQKSAVAHAKRSANR